MVANVGELVLKARVSRSAMSDLCMEYRKLVVDCVQREASRGNHGYHLEDLVQQGMLGLMKAVHAYDPDREIAFETCARRYVEYHVRPYMRMEMLRGHATGTEPQHKRGRALRKLYAEAGYDTEKYLALARQKYKTGISDAGFVEAVCKPVHCSEDQAPGVSDGTDLEQKLWDMQRDRLGKMALRQAIACLPEKQRAALVGNLLEGRTLSDIGVDVGLTAERVRQLRDIAFKKIKMLVLEQLRQPMAA